MTGKIIAILLLVLPLAAFIYFLVVKKKTKLPWFVVALLGIAVLLCLITLGLFIFTMNTPH
jgi:hypothetical protein